MSRCSKLFAPAVAGALAWASLSGPAAASDDAKPEIIVLESYHGARPDDARELLRPLYAELEERGYIVDADTLSGRIDERVAVPGHELESARVAEAVELAREGYQSWLDARPKLAVKQLNGALKLFRERPATIARAPALRDHIFISLIGLALAYKRGGNTDASTAAMAELLRSFPDREISRSEYGPEPRKLYKKIKRELTDQGLGTLRVRSDDPGVTVFVNGRYAGVGNLHLSKLYAGTYRIYLQKGNTRGRVHNVTVNPGTESQVSIAWGFETSLRSGVGFVGLEFATARERHERAHGYAVTTARRLGASGVIVVGIRPFQGRRSVVATLLSLDSSKPIRSGAVAIEPTEPSEAQMRSLARFLAGDGKAPGIIVGPEELPSVTKRPQTADAPASPRYQKLRWGALIGGAVGIAGGITLIAIHQPATSGGAQQPTSRNTRTAGIVLTAGGAALVGVGALLWRRGRVERRDTVVSVGPAGTDGWGLSVAGRF